MKNNIFASQRFKYGATAVVTTVIFIVAVILLNVVVAKIFDRTEGGKIDLTDEKVFEITDDTKNFLKTLDKDVKITIFMDERTLNDSGTEGKSIVEVINKYKQYSDKITVEYASVETNPEIYTQYSDMYKGNLMDYIGVVVCEDNIRPLSQGDLISYTMNASTSGFDTANTTEQAVTSAIMNVVDDTQMKITILSDKSYSYITDLTEMLQANGYDIENVDATLGEIDEESAMVILNTPVSDISSITLDKLEKYLYNDGKYGKNLFYIGSYQQGEMPNINTLLTEYGLEVKTGRVMDTNANNMYSIGNSYAILTLNMNDEYTKNLQNKTFPVAMAMPCPINVLWDVKDTRSTAVLLTTDATAVVIPNDATSLTEDYINSLDRGAVPIMAVGTKSDAISGTSSNVSNVLVLTSPGMLEESLFEMATLNNSDYVFATINKLNGREQSITVSPKSLQGSVLDATDSQTNTMGVFAIVIIPLAVAVAGVVIYIRRKHK